MDYIQVASTPHPMQSNAVSEITDKCDACGETLYVGSWPYCPHGTSSLVTEKTYPFVTKHFDGTPIEVTSRAHEAALMRQHGVHKRDDVAFNEKEYIGYNRHTDKQEYKEGRGVGMPGCWV